jgi:hypothetical protein
MKLLGLNAIYAQANGGELPAEATWAENNDFFERMKRGNHITTPTLPESAKCEYEDLVMINDYLGAIPARWWEQHDPSWIEYLRTMPPECMTPEIERYVKSILKVHP